MESALRWIDFLMNPINMIGMTLFSGFLSAFFWAGLMWFVKAERKIGSRIILIGTVCFMMVVAGFFVFIYWWYNTPLGPPLNLVK
jgi:hypothetical protein